MADPNTTQKENTPQQVDQLKQDLSSEESSAEVADINMDKEFEIAKENTNGSGDQPSNPNPVTREAIQEGRDTNPDVDASAPSISHDTKAGNPDQFKDIASEVTPE